MKEKEDFLTKAADALAHAPVPPGPPQQTIDATLAKLTDAAGSLPPVTVRRQIWILERIKALKQFPKLAAAAVILIAAGYLAGRLSAPSPPDVEQLRAAVEPVIRQNLLEEMGRYWQASTAASYARLKDHLSEQYRRDLNQFAAQTLAASTTVTNHLLEDLIAAINSAQTQNRRWVTAALQQIESNRLNDKNQLSNGLATLAFYTEDELLQTKYDIAQFLYNTQTNTITPNIPETPNPK